MRKISIWESAKVNARVEKAWEVIGPNFVNIATWGPGIYKSWVNEEIDKKFEDAPAGGRFCDLGSSGIIDERIIHYDKDNYEITWSAASDNLPGFLKNLQNSLKIEKVDGNSCRISSNITADAEGLMGTLMGRMIQKKFAETLPDFMSSWKLYAETGKLTETKQKEMSAVPANSK